MREKEKESLPVERTPLRGSKVSDLLADLVMLRPLLIELIDFVQVSYLLVPPMTYGLLYYLTAHGLSVVPTNGYGAFSCCHQNSAQGIRASSTNALINNMLLCQDKE